MISEAGEASTELRAERDADIFTLSLRVATIISPPFLGRAVGSLSELECQRVLLWLTR
jgi:hypothetical protein